MIPYETKQPNSVFKGTAVILVMCVLFDFSSSFLQTTRNSERDEPCTVGQRFSEKEHCEIGPSDSRNERNEVNSYIRDVRADSRQSRIDARDIRTDFKEIRSELDTADRRDNRIISKDDLRVRENDRIRFDPSESRYNLKNARSNSRQNLEESRRTREYRINSRDSDNNRKLEERNTAEDRTKQTRESRIKSRDIDINKKLGQRNAAEDRTRQTRESKINSRDIDFDRQTRESRINSRDIAFDRRESKINSRDIDFDRQTRESRTNSRDTAFDRRITESRITSRDTDFDRKLEDRNTAEDRTRQTRESRVNSKDTALDRRTRDLRINFRDIKLEERSTAKDRTSETTKSKLNSRDPELDSKTEERNNAEDETRQTRDSRINSGMNIDRNIGANERRNFRESRNSRNNFDTDRRSTERDIGVTEREFRKFRNSRSNSDTGRGIISERASRDIGVSEREFREFRNFRSNSESDRRTNSREEASTEKNDDRRHNTKETRVNPESRQFLQEQRVFQDNTPTQERRDIRSMESRTPDLQRRSSPPLEERRHFREIISTLRQPNSHRGSRQIIRNARIDEPRTRFDTRKVLDFRRLINGENTRENIPHVRKTEEVIRNLQTTSRDRHFVDSRDSRNDVIRRTRDIEVSEIRESKNPNSRKSRQSRDRISEYFVRRVIQMDDPKDTSRVRERSQPTVKIYNDISSIIYDKYVRDANSNEIRYQLNPEKQRTSRDKIFERHMANLEKLEKERNFRSRERTTRDIPQEAIPAAKEFESHSAILVNSLQAVLACFLVGQIWKSTSKSSKFGFDQWFNFAKLKAE